jgi:hypothetical protein
MCIMSFHHTAIRAPGEIRGAFFTAKPVLGLFHVKQLRA